MKRLLSFTGMAVFVAGIAACGGESANPEFMNAIPNSGTVTMDLIPQNAVQSSLTQGLGTAPDCHPHLFQRTDEVVRILNHHILKAFARIDAIVDNHPKMKNETVHVWERAVGTLMFKTTLTKVSSTQFTIETDVKLASAPDSAYVKILSGSFSTTDGQPHTGSGSLSLDLSALASVDTAEKAQGQITVTFNVVGATKTLQIQLANFEPDSSDIDRPPRNGNYVFARTAGVGGSVKFQEEVVLYCPSNPQLQVALVQTVARWGKVNGALVGRADSIATGGQIPQGDKWLGLTCFDLSHLGADAGDDGVEHYWQMKLENGSGNVVTGDATYNASDSADPTSSCDPTFGPIPALSSNQNDYNFSAINFNDGSVVPYPGQP